MFVQCVLRCCRGGGVSIFLIVALKIRISWLTLALLHLNLPPMICKEFGQCMYEEEAWQRGESARGFSWLQWDAQRRESFTLIIFILRTPLRFSCDFSFALGGPERWRTATPCGGDGAPVCKGTHSPCLPLLPLTSTPDPRVLRCVMICNHCEV